MPPERRSDHVGIRTHSTLSAEDLKDRRSRLQRYAYPLIGGMDPKDIKRATVMDVLLSVRAAGKARSTMRNVGGDISVVLQDLCDAEVIPRNVARIKYKDLPEALPAPTKRSKKVRAVPTDAELVEYLAWVHPEKRHRRAVRERQVMSCIARILGGLRTSDLHAVRWELFGAPEFLVATVERQKRVEREDGGDIQEIEIPEMLRPILKQWFAENGSKATGLIFPKLRGRDAGKAGRKKSSHAHAVRKDFRRMWGIDQLVTETTTRSNGRPLTHKVWKTDARPMTPREVQLLTDAHPKYLPADFHTWRRATAQALKRGNVNIQTSKDVLNHASLQATERYLRSADVITIPDAALPPSLPERIGSDQDDAKEGEATEAEEEP